MDSALRQVLALRLRHLEEERALLREVLEGGGVPPPSAEHTPTLPSTEHLDEVLTVDEAATLLRMERKSVYALASRGELPGARRVGRSIRISRSTLLGWLSSGQGRARARGGNAG